jgi:formate hydrogenlyase subunit 4
MMQAVQWLSFIITMILVPPLSIGFVRKIKARLQNRIGAPIYQPLLDLIRLLKKAETISETTSWVFRASAIINFSGIIVLAFLVPWLSYKPVITSDDLFLVVYLFALCRFFTVLSALDAGSVFGGFGASREVTLSLLVEPAVVLALVSLGVIARSTDLGVIFSYGESTCVGSAVLWLLSGTGLFLASLVELSRMPVDDPTTHLELTMVHEAMILENSGRNLALVEYTQWLRLTMLLGLCGQCMLHACYAACSQLWRLDAIALGGLSLAFLAVMLVLVAVLESNTVKLRWTRVPDFIAYSVAMSLLSMLIAVGSK